MPQTEPSPRRRRGRRPADEVRTEVLDATTRVLLDEGITAVTFERIARESGASKTTLYKWWPSPGVLAAEAYVAHSGPVLEFPRTGDLRADLIAQVSAFLDLLTSGRAAHPVAGLIGAAQSDPQLARAWADSYALPRRELARDRLRAAQREGQLDDEADLDLIVDQIWGACYHRLLVLQVPVVDIDATLLVTTVLRGWGVTGP